VLALPVLWVAYRTAALARSGSRNGRSAGVQVAKLRFVPASAGAELSAADAVRRTTLGLVLCWLTFGVFALISAAAADANGTLLDRWSRTTIMAESPSP
jgi:hypothetical protein